MDAAVKGTTINKEKKQKHPDRITLPPSALEKLGRWIGLLQNRSAGIKVTRSDLVTWLINSHSEHLSTSEIADLEEKFFDNLKYAKWAVKEIMEARTRGEILNLKLVGQEVKATNKQKQNDSGKSKKLTKSSIQDFNSASQSDLVDASGESWPSGS